MKKELTRWTVDAPLKDLGAACGIVMGALLARVGKNSARLVIDSIWGALLEGLKSEYGIDPETFKGTANR